MVIALALVAIWMALLIWRSLRRYLVRHYPLSPHVIIVRDEQLIWIRIKDRIRGGLATDLLLALLAGLIGYLLMVATRGAAGYYLVQPGLVPGASLTPLAGALGAGCLALAHAVFGGWIDEYYLFGELTPCMTMGAR